MLTDKHSGNKYRNIKNYNNKFPTSNDMPLFLHLFDQPLSNSDTVYICFMQFNQLSGRQPKCGVDVGIFFAFGFIEEAAIALEGPHVIHRQKREAIQQMKKLYYKCLRDQHLNFFPATFTPYQRCLWIFLKINAPSGTI